MRRLTFGICVRATMCRACAALLLALVVAAGPAPPWGDLHGWAGKYPTDQDHNPPRRILRIHAIRATLQALLSPADLRKLASFNVEDPVAIVDGFAVVSQCMPHDCGGQNAMVVIDTKHPRIWIGFHAHTGTGNSTRWFGTTGHHDVPASVLNRF